jgi:membrane protease YdiL (CAAX protease family)
MAVFVILIRVFVVFSYLEGPKPAKEPVLTREDFKQQIEKKQQALKELMQKNQELALGLGYLSMLILASLITGGIFLADYIAKKRHKIEVIPQTLDSPQPAWSIGDVIKVIILFIFYNYLFSIFAHIVSANRFDRRMDLVTSTGVMDILTLIFILWFVIDKRRQGLDALGVSFKKFLKNIGIAIYSYVTFLPILAILLILIVGIAKVLNYNPPPEPIYELVFEEKRPILLVMISGLATLLGPAIEEVFFRGFLYGALKKNIGILWAILVSSLFFSLLHTNLIGFMPILSLGIFLAYLREKTGSLVPPITVHIIHNTALISFMFLLRRLTG